MTTSVLQLRSARTISTLVFAGIVVFLAPGAASGQEVEEAIEILGKATYTPPNATDYYLKDSMPEVMQAVQSVKTHHLSEESFWRHYRAGRKERAMAETIFALRVFPNHPEALGLLGIVCRELDEVSTPIPFYERALRLYPYRAYTRAQYGTYLASIGQTSAGRVYLEEALRMDPYLDVARGWLESLDGPAVAPPPAAGGSRR